MCRGHHRGGRRGRDAARRGAGAGGGDDRARERARAELKLAEDVLEWATAEERELLTGLSARKLRGLLQERGLPIPDVDKRGMPIPTATSS